MNLELFLRLCRMAQIAGFAQVQIAGEHLPEVNSLVPSGGEALGDFDSGFLSVM
jgi:hypothetical protein